MSETSSAGTQEMAGSWSRRRLLQTGALTGLAGAALASAPARALAAAEDYPPRWAIGPFTRYAGNPLLEPRPGRFDSFAAYNPGVVYRDGAFRMLYRGQRPDLVSEIGGAISHDGHHFHRVGNGPVIRNAMPNETHGVEDPRLIERDGTYYAFFTGYDGTNIDINEAVSRDAVNWQQLGPVLHDNKNGAVLCDPTNRPVRMNGRYLMFYGQSGSGTFLAHSTDLRHWSGGIPLNMHFPDSYVPYEICVAVTDYPTTAGAGLNHDIVLFVAGTLMARGRWYYAISEVLFDGREPRRQRSQLHHAVLRPLEPYESNGQTQRTVFMNSISLHRGQWLMYYGAGDTVTALATAPSRRQD